MAEQKNRVALLGAFVIVVFVLFGYLALKVGGIRAGNQIQVQAYFDDAQGLIENGDIRISGIRVGSIGSMSVEDGRALVTLYISRDVQVRDDVTATIKAKSLLGEKFIELLPVRGSDAPVLKSGDMIRNTYVSAELPDLASQIAPLLSQIDPEDVARMVRVTSRILEGNEEQIPQLMNSLARITTNIDVLLEDNAPRFDRIIEGAYDAVVNAGPKLEILLDTTQSALENANLLIETNAPRLDAFMDELSGFDVERINRMLVELDEAMSGSTDTLVEAGQVMGKVNNLLDGFEGLTWHHIISLARDEGILVRMRQRKEADREITREQWVPQRNYVELPSSEEESEGLSRATE